MNEPNSESDRLLLETIALAFGPLKARTFTEDLARFCAYIGSPASDRPSDAGPWLYALRLAQEGSVDSLSRMLESAAYLQRTQAVAFRLPEELLSWLSARVAESAPRKPGRRATVSEADLLLWRAAYRRAPPRRKKVVLQDFVAKFGLHEGRSKKLLGRHT